MSESVYILGAGFSKGLGYPLTGELLSFVWDVLGESDRKQLTKIIKFHNPGFNPNHPFSYPNIEALLTQIDSNIELFDYTRNQTGNFKKEDLKESKNKLLVAMANKFHEQQKSINRKNSAWLFDFFERVKGENATIISFNYDLAIESCSESPEDSTEIQGKIPSEIYGLNNETGTWKILKPHGSLNWFYQSEDDKSVAHSGKLKKSRVRRLLTDDDVYVFRLFRQPVSKREHVYVPHLIPPTFIKRFGGKVYKQTFRNCVSALTTAKKVYFLGCSLPEADFHSKFMIRCGLYNQIYGAPRQTGRSKASGASKVTVVNPDPQAARNTAALILPEHLFQFEQKQVSDWLDGELSS